MTMHVTNPHIVRYVCVKRYVSMLRELVLLITSERKIRRQRSKNQPQEIHCTERASVRMFTAYGKIVFYANGRHRIFVSLEHMSASKKKMNGAEALRIGSKWQSLNYKQMKRQSESLFHSYAENLMPSFSGRLVCERAHKARHTHTHKRIGSIHLSHGTRQRIISTILPSAARRIFATLAMLRESHAWCSS